MPRRTLPPRLLGAVVVAAAFTVPAPALASDASVDEAGVLAYTAGFGEANDVTLTPSGTDVRVTDVVDVAPGANCVADEGTTTSVVCSGATAVDARLGDGDDARALDIGERPRVDDADRAGPNDPHPERFHRCLLSVEGSQVRRFKSSRVAKPIAEV